MHFHALALATLAASAAAIDTSNITEVTCGKTKYPAKQVELAWAEGCRLFEAEQTVGTGNYPHQFNNRESLNFSADGPYQEFPLVKKGKFGGKAKRSSKSKAGKTKAKNNNNPGADRVVFNPDLDGNCVYVGAMTHTGAEEQNGFVECEMGEAKDDEGAGAAVAPAWYLAASGLAAYWAMGM